jgi:YegS/Rv2252/BmrU family lipid kinase
MQSPVTAIINPVAGRAAGARLRARALPELRRIFPGLHELTTERPGHATDLARSARDSGLVVAVGGDGTVREVATGLAGTEAELAVIPCGSGNDFDKNVGIPRELGAACRLAAEGQARPLDLVRIAASGEAVEQEWLCANAAGFGFDALVIEHTRSFRRLRGMPLYLAAVFRAVRSYTCPKVIVTVGDETWQQPILLLAAANGRCYGGGMKIAPAAEPDDGLLEICIIDEVDRLTVLRDLPSFVEGTHVKLPEVRMLRAPRLELEFEDPCPLQLDGDLVDTAGYRRFEIEILPRALKVRTRPVAGATG